MGHVPIACLDLYIVSKHVFTIKIWNLPSKEIDIVTFFQEYGILLERQVCGSSYKEKLYFGNVLLNPTKKLKRVNMHIDNDICVCISLCILLDGDGNLKWCHNQLNIL